MLIEKHKTKTKSLALAEPNPALMQWRGYIIALLGVGIAALVRWALLRGVGDLPLYITFYPAVFAAAVVGGTGPGLLATILSAMTADVLFTTPVGSVHISPLAETVATVIFIALNFGVSFLGGRLLKKSEALQESIRGLRKREQVLIRQAQLIDLAPAATLVHRPDGTITFWSQGAERLYGWTKEEALGQRSHDLLRTEFPEPMESIVAKLRGGGIWSGELHHYTRENRQLSVDSYWLAECNAQGEVEELLESNTDITERKRLQEHLEEAVEERTAKLREAMADLQHMSYSMVHDMRAPLRAMQGFAVILGEECPGCQHPPASDYLHYIRESSSRLDRLITDALNYNRVISEELPLTSVELGRLLHGMIHTYPNLQPRVADITIEFEEQSVLGNESLLTQCFSNLLDNAVKFVAPGIKPRIRIWVESSPLNEPPSTIIHIEDNGIGIPENAQEKIFGMFERMHRQSEYPGTGIGLAIVKKAVERMNGRIGLESTPGKGSKFWVELTTATKPRIPAHLQEAG